MNNSLTDPAKRDQETLHGNGAELKQLLGCRISECDDVEFLRDAVEKLWMIIDDIDSYGDMCKSDDAFFRNRVERRQKERWTEVEIISDGYSLFRKAAQRLSSGVCES